MKNYYLKKMAWLFVLVFTGGVSYAQLNYTWMKGSSQVDQNGVYGTLGVANAANTPGGREIPMSWKDASGNFWLFGGQGFDDSGTYGFLNDLWKYTPATNQWTWVKGTKLTDEPGIYGTLGVAAAANTPGGREAAVTWVDASGNLWLFGGLGIDANFSYGEMNDLWKYTVSTNQWTWMKGSDTGLQNAIYGTQGVSTNTNRPGARTFPSSWTDAAGNFWMFGGTGYDANSNYGNLNDLWKYTIANNQWTWMKGSNTPDQNGTYGTLGTAAATNNPGSRFSQNTWTDATGNLWLFGGSGFGATTNVEDFLNDTWKYTISTNQWTWVNGNNGTGQMGNYGTLGVAAPSNIPGARGGGFNWMDASGNFYVFGGVGYVTNVEEALNDVWKYSTTTNEWTWIKGSNLGSQPGVYGIQGTVNSANMPGARAGGASWVDASNNVWLFGGNGYDNGTSPGDLDDLWKMSTCTSFPNVNASSAKPVICAGEQIQIAASGATTYSWNSNPPSTAQFITVKPASTTTYVVTGTDNNGCSSTFSITQTVNNCTGISTRELSQVLYNAYPNPNDGSFTLSGPEFSKPTTLFIFNALGQNVFEQTLTASNAEVHTQLAPGIYHYSVLQENQKIGSGKIIVR